MGDFNDEPFDVSLVTHTLSTRQRQRVIEADTPRLWNLMWPAAGIPDGSFYYTSGHRAAQAMRQPQRRQPVKSRPLPHRRGVDS